MKKSYYNIEIDKAQGKYTLIFNSATGGFIKLDEKHTNIINNLSDVNIRNKYCSEINKMKEKGLVVEEFTNEKEIIQLHENITKFSQQGLSLTIAPTLDCNMRCAYCYENKSSIKMDERTIKNVIQYVEKSLQNKKFLHIAWYGGEPLLEMNSIVKMSKAFIEICEQKDIPYSSSMITNGVLLNEKTAKILVDDCKLRSAQITLDGFGETHDSSRPMVNGKGSFFTIIKNIESIKSFFNVSIRVNVSRNNYKEVNNLAKYLIEEKEWFVNDKLSIYLAPITNCQEACQIGEDETLTFEQFGNINSKFLNQLIELEREQQIKFRSPKPIRTACGATTMGGHIIGPEGEFYKCWQEVGLSKKTIGDIYTGMKLNDIYLSYLNIELPDECIECKYLPLCFGGCPSERLKNDNKPYCYTTKVTIKENLLKIYKIWNKERSKLSDVR